MRTPNGGLQPQAVVNGAGRVDFVYLKGDPAGCDVFYTRQLEGATNFSESLRVNRVAGDAVALGTVRGAQLAVGKHGRVHVVWNGSQPAAGGKGAPMFYTRFEDSGARFEAERNLMTSTGDLDGGGSIAADGAGNVYVVWHGHPRGGADGEENRGVYLARSADEGRTFAPEVRVSPAGTGACGCCGLKAFSDRDGRVAILYRSADGSGNRDSVLLVSEDRGVTFNSTVLGKWHISTCPMSTPALGDGPGNEMLAMWETEGQIYRCSLGGRGSIFENTAVAADAAKGNRKHPAFSFNPASNRLLLTWVEGTGWAKGGELAWECIDLRTGAKTLGRASGVPPWSVPAAIPEPNGGFRIFF